MDDQQQPRWRPTRRQLLWTSGIVSALAIAVLVGYRYDITLWDWIKLLVVPAVIAGGGIWFNQQQSAREQRIASERAQDDTLQAYLDGMSELLTDKDQPLHRAQSGDRLSTVARARTLTALGRLDASRKRSVLTFLYESGLIYKEDTLLGESDLLERRHNIVSLQGAGLGRADLSFAYLPGADLRAVGLSGADLFMADLRGALLHVALLNRSSLRGADLSGADLSGANLSGADLSEADLSRAWLLMTNLSGATGWTEKQLEQASSLRGTTMPNGQKYEEWLKDREQSKDADNE